MFCPKCGRQIEDNAAFCPYCGAGMGQVKNSQPAGNDTWQTAYDSPNNTYAEQNYNGFEENNADSGSDGGYGMGSESDGGYGTGSGMQGAKTQKAGKGKIPVKIIAIAAAAVVVLVIAVVLVAGLFGGSGYDVAYFYDSDNNETAFFVGTKEIGTVEGYVYDASSNLDKTAHFALVSDDDSGYYTAYYIAENGVNKIQDDCNSITIAANANVALVLDDEGNLYQYECSGKKLTKVAEDEGICLAAISGDGKTYAYTVVEYDEDSWDYIYTSYIGKSETKVKDVIIAGMSKTGKYIYGYKYDDDGNMDLVTVSSKGETTKIASDIDSIEGYNEDGTEIVFISDERVYVSVKGGDKQKVASGSYISMFYDYTEKTESGLYYPVSSFKNSVMYVYSDSDYTATIYRLNSSYEGEEIADDVDNFGYGTDLKYMYYLDGTTLYRIELKAGKKAKEINDDVYSFIAVSEDGTCCYYLDYDDTVHYVKNTSDSKISSLNDVDYIYGTIKDSILYARVSVDDEYSLYYIKGKSATKITGDEDIILKYYRMCDTVYAYDTKEGTIYQISGKKLKELSTSLENLTSGGGFF